LLATGQLELAAVDRESVQPVPIPDTLSTLLAGEELS
jgi:acyl-CoA thioesterase FadM